MIKKIILLIFFIILCLLIVDSQNIESQILKLQHEDRRKTYNEFKKITMNILMKEWEKTNYDFFKLDAVTYLLNQKYCYLSFLVGMINIFRNLGNIVFKISLNNFIKVNPFLFGILFILMWYNTSQLFPVIRTDEFIFYVMISQIINFCINKYLNNNN